MDHAKIDAGLALALSDVARDNEQYFVTVRKARPLTAEEQADFTKLGGTAADSPLPVLSARVSHQALEELIQMPWVRLVSLSRQLNPT